MILSSVIKLIQILIERRELLDILDEKVKNALVLSQQKK
jgi:hypothetical protein